jgi:hypothetical protein
VRVGPTVTSVQGDPPRGPTYYARVHAINSCGSTVTGEISFFVP